MTNPGVIPLSQADNVWDNLSNIGSLKPFISEIDINKPTSFTASSSRIYGDLSNSTFSNRLLFQTYVPDSYTALGLIPNGIGDTSVFSIFNSSNPDISNIGTFSIDSSALTIQSGKTGTGSYLPININTGGTTSITIDVSGKTSLNNNNISDLGNPINLQDAVTKVYVDTLVAITSGSTTIPMLSQVLIQGNSTGSNVINMNSNKIINLLDPTNPQEAATKQYVDTHTSSGSSGSGGPRWSFVLGGM